MPDHQLEKAPLRSSRWGTSTRRSFSPGGSLRVHGLIGKMVGRRNEDRDHLSGRTIFNTGWFRLQVTEGNFTIVTQKIPRSRYPFVTWRWGRLSYWNTLPLQHSDSMASDILRHRRKKAGIHSVIIMHERLLGSGAKESGTSQTRTRRKREGCDDRIQIRIESSPANLVVMGIMIAVNQHRDITKNAQGNEVTTQERNSAFISGLQND